MKGFGLDEVFPGGSYGKESACSAGYLVRSLGWEKGTHLPPPVFLPGESHGQKSLVGYGSQGCRVGND